MNNETESNEIDNLRKEVALLRVIYSRASYVAICEIGSDAGYEELCSALDDYDGGITKEFN